MKFHSKAFSSLSWLTLLVCLAVPFTASASTPSEIKLAWNANIEEDLAGYKIYYKIGSPVLEDDPEATVIDIPKTTLTNENLPEYTVPGLDLQQIYFFAVTAYDNEDPVKESELSEGVCTLRITEPLKGFYANSSDYTDYKVKGRGVPETPVEIFANNTSLGTVTVDVDGGWTKHVDFSPLSQGDVSLTLVSGGITSFPVSGIYDILAPQPSSGPVVSLKKDNFATIEWETTEPGTSMVEYGPDAQYGSSKSISTITKHHSVLLTGLSPEVTYHFRVSSVDPAGNGPDAGSTDNNPSGDFTFTTDPSTPPSIVGHPFIYRDFEGEFSEIIIEYDEPDLQNATDEDNYSFSPSLLFYTQVDRFDDIFVINDYSYVLFMKYIPEFEIITLTVNGITDSLGNPVTPNTITINDNDSDNMADDWEVEHGLNPQVNDSTWDPDRDGYSNYKEYLARTHPRSAASVPFRIVDTVPQNNAGISNSTRVPNDSSVAVLIASSNGIDITAEDTIRFTIVDGIHTPYERNLYADTVRVVKLSEDDDTQATLLWVVYDRSLDFIPEPVFPFEAVVNVSVEAVDVYDNTMNPAGVVIKIESEEAHRAAQDNLPPTAYLDPNEPGYDAGIEVTGGDLEGAMIFYNSSEPMTPTFGPLSDIKPPALANGDAAVGVPVNLLPHTVFDRPVKIFIPSPGGSDVWNLRLYYYNGVEWQLASDEFGNILPGGEGWMVPGSRVNHNNTSPPMIEIEVYHFSAAQAVTSISAGGSGSFVAGGSSGGGGGGGCFIGSAERFSLASLLSLIGLMGSLSLLGLLSFSRFFRALR